MAKNKNESKPSETSAPGEAPSATADAPSSVPITLAASDQAVAELKEAADALGEAMVNVDVKVDALARSFVEVPSAPVERPMAAPGAMPQPSPPREPWRTVALATRPATVAFAMGCVSYLGGELEEDPSRVEVLRTLEGFELIELEVPEDLDKVRVSLAREVEDLERRALAIGYKLVRQGARK